MVVLEVPVVSCRSCRAGRVVSVMLCHSCRVVSCRSCRILGESTLLLYSETALDGTAYATVGNLFSLILECRKLWSSVRACEAAGNMGAKIHELLMNTYRSSIVAFLVYFQSSYAGLLGPLSCVSNFFNFTQETFQSLKPTFTDIAVTVKRDAPTLGRGTREVLPELSPVGFGLRQK